MPILTVIPQLVPGVWTAGADCGPASGASVVAFCTRGQVEPTAAQVRSFVRTPEGRTDYGPTNVRQIAAALWRGWGIEMLIESPDSFDAFWNRIRDPNVVGLVAIQYTAFQGTPLYASRSGFTGSHSITAAGADDDGCLEADPLADGVRGVPKGPLRVSRKLLRSAAGYVWVVRNGRRVRLGVGAIIVGYARAEPEPAPAPEPEQPEEDVADNLFADTFLSYALDLPVGTVMYSDVGLTVRYSAVSEADPGRATKTLALLGAPIGRDAFRVANGDRGVFVKRGTLAPRRLDEPIRVGA